MKENNYPMDDIGKIPPQAIDVENAVIGALMIEREAFQEISEILTPECFYKPANSLIFRAIRTLYINQQPIDMLTITEQLRRDGVLEEVGGAYNIALLSSSVNSAAHLEHHARILLQKNIARELIKFSSEISVNAYDESKDVTDILAEVEQRLTEIKMDKLSRGIMSIKDVVYVARERLIELRQEREAGRKGYIPTPIKELDRVLKGGFKNKKLIIVGARPRQGKTQFILETAKKVSETSNNEVLLFNLEMDAEELCFRLLFEEETIDDYAVETGTFTNDELLAIETKLLQIAEMKLKIVDDEYSLMNIISKCRKEKRENPDLSAVFIDYLQLIETNMRFQTRDLEVGYITRKLKQLAKELDLPIVLLAQLNRDAKGEPALEHLRESGNIEQDADVVILLDRPTLRGVEYDPDTGHSWKQAGQFIVAKHRQGVTTKVKFSHDKRFKRMFSYANIDAQAAENYQVINAWNNQEAKEINNSPF